MKITKILTYILLAFVFFYLFMLNVNDKEFNKKEILTILISTASIIVAIIITYLFSKLFTEKTIRIERKKEIDSLSIKITDLRRIAHRIRRMHEFWKFKDTNVKSIIDRKYPTLTYEEYRSENRIKKYSPEEILVINEELYGTDGQAYLALKGLEDGASDFSFYNEVNPQNYSIDDISRYKAYSNSFWYLLENSDDAIVNFKNIHSFWLNIISELYFKITGRHIDEINYKSQIKDLLSEYDNVVFEKHAYLTALNSDIFPAAFKNSFLNMLIYVLIVLASLFVFILNVDFRTSLIMTISIVSLFMTNTIALIIIIAQAIKRELNIKEVFKI